MPGQLRVREWRFNKRRERYGRKPRTCRTIHKDEPCDVFMGGYAKWIVMQTTRYSLRWRGARSR